MVVSTSGRGHRFVSRQGWDTERLDTPWNQDRVRRNRRSSGVYPDGRSQRKDVGEVFRRSPEDTVFILHVGGSGCGEF